MSLEVGESLKGGVLDGASVGEKGEVGVVGYPKVVQDAKECYHSCEGDEVRLLEFLTLLEEG